MQPTISAGAVRRRGAAAHRREFDRHFGQAPRFYRAPGRVNLIGEHTDYNQGWVMPAAIDLDAWVGIAPRPDRRIVIRSGQYPDAAVFDLDAGPRRAEGGGPENPQWAAALGGIALLWEREGQRLRGANLLIHSDIPVGAGLSSSAAVEVAVGYALASESGIAVDLTALALLCQRASHEFALTRCGIMDQFIAAHGRAGRIAQLDTRALRAEWLGMPEGASLVVADTMVKHDHATNQYNQRRRECEDAVKALARRLPGVAALRDVGARELERHRGLLSDAQYARCRHVLGENQRVAEAAAALRAGDFEALGRLLAQSHASLRDDYEVSCPELDYMVELCGQVGGAYGARMMGGGFGGCVIALVRPERVAAFRAGLARAYAGATGLAPDTWLCRAAPGVAAVPDLEAAEEGDAT